MFTPDEMQILLQEKERQLEYLTNKQRFTREQPRPYTGIVPQFDTEVNLSDDALDKIRKTNIKIELMNQAFSELAEGQQAIMDRLDTAKLRRLLKSQLLEKGITEDFELGIKPGEGKLIGIGNLLDSQVLLQEGLQFWATIISFMSIFQRKVHTYFVRSGFRFPVQSCLFWSSFFVFTMRYGSF
jgi:two-component system phosphate regulon sensor histidine kinase PhoR